MTDYMLGFLVGFLVVALIAVVVYRVCNQEWKPKRCQYDERQQRARGIAYRNGFWAAVAFLLLWEVLQLAEAPLPPVMLLALGLMIVLGAFAVSCILLDAYLGLRGNPKRTVLLLVVIMAVNLFSAWANFTHNREDGLWWLNLAFGVVMVMMLAALGVKALLRRWEDKEEEE